MTALSIQPPFPLITDIDGQPLEDGYIWIGTANLNPITNPIAVYWDAALTQPAAQPIRTRGGYPVNAGTPARLYVGSDYSIQVQNKNGSVLYSAPQATERYGALIISSADISFLQAGSGAVVRTAQSKMRDVVSVKDFGAVGDGVADDTAAIQNAIDYASNNAKNVYIPAGTYLTSGTLQYDSVGNGGILITGTSTSDIISNTGSVIKYTGNGSAFKFTGTPVYSAIKNITFLGIDGNGAIGLDIDNAWYVDVDQCVFRFFRGVGIGAGIKIHYTVGGFAGVTSIRNCFISQCYICVWTNKQDINVVRIDKSTLFDSVFGFCQGDGFVNPCSSRNITFSECLFEGNSDYDIFSYGGAQNWNIIGCYFEQNDPLKNLSRITLNQAVSVRNCAISIIGNTFSKQLQGAGQSLVYVKDADGVIFKNNWSAFGNANDRYSIFVDGGKNYELWQMSVPFGDTPYPLYENSTVRTTGSVYKTDGGIAIAAGIEFPAVAVSSTNPNTLDDYEEGTWTPSNDYVTLTNNVTARYRKIGAFVYASFDVTFPVNAQGNSSEVVALPFAWGGGPQTASVTWSDYGALLNLRLDYVNGGTFYDASGVALTNANLSGKRIVGMYIYSV